MNDPIFKRYLRWLSLAVGVALLGLIALNWLVDPLQFYRRASYPPFIIDQKRFQIPGIAKHYDYDAVVVGTSMSENIRVSDVRERFGWTILNLALQGGSAREQRLALEVALRTGKLRHVLWDVNWEYLRGDPDWVADYDGTFPFYFYDENAGNEIGSYLWSVDTTKSSAKILLRRAGLKTYESRTPEEVFTWFNRKQFGIESLRRSWKKYVTKSEVTYGRRAGEYALSNLNGNFDRHFLEVIRQHPEVEFKLYFPPFSLAYYADLRAANPQVFADLLANKRHIVQALESCPNAQIFDFQSEVAIVRNATNYCDLMHYSHTTTLQLLDDMRAGNRQACNVPADELRRLVESAQTDAWLRATLELP